MKSKISILMLLSVLFFYSCLTEELTSSKSAQIENEVDLRGNQPVIFVHWEDNQDDPVEGARVFDAVTNELIAETNAEGKAYINPEPGKYRVVDPNYGTQQALVYYPEDFEYNEETGEEREVIGWTIDGKPIYADE